MRQCLAPRHLAEVRRESARPLAKTLGSFAVAGSGASGLVCVGAVTAQYGDELNAATILAMCFAALLAAMIAAVVKVYEIHSRRTPDQIHAEAMARQARRCANPDRAMHILMIDKALSRAERLTSEHSFELLSPPGDGCPTLEGVRAYPPCLDQERAAPPADRTPFTMV
jgi:hypothetical protein